MGVGGRWCGAAIAQAAEAHQQADGAQQTDDQSTGDGHRQAG